jgi:hypothetical protein
MRSARSSTACPAASFLGFGRPLMAELNARVIIRADNNPIGDYCEFVVAAHYEVAPEGSSNAGHDVVTPDGARVQVEGRRIGTRGNIPPHFSGIRNLDDEPPPFDVLIGLLLNRDFSIREAWEIPVERVRHYGVYRPHTNSWSLKTIRGHMRNDPKLKQIQLRHAP